MDVSISVRGMMYYRRALKLQAFLDMATEKGQSKLLLSGAYAKMFHRMSLEGMDSVKGIGF